MFRRLMKCLQACLFSVVLLLGATLTASAENYADFAERLVSDPQNATFRPDLEDVLLSSANQYRSSKRARNLRMEDGLLLKAARAHALDLLQQNAMGHRSSTGHDFEARMRSLHPGVMFMGRLAENAARERSKGPADEGKVRKLFQQWVKSASHRRTLLSRDYERVATGVVQRGDVIYAVQIFAGPPVKSNMFSSTPAPAKKQGSALY